MSNTRKTTFMDIQLLPKSLRHHLRSGIRIQSIAHCVSELVLNSLDAKSTSIAVRVNLLQYKVQVIDNGTGITKKNLKILGIRYTTSKYFSAKDYKKHPSVFGYRGEALASIIKLSEVVEVTSRTENSSTTYSKTFKNGKYDSIQNTTQRPSAGTTVKIGNFFYNTPVRQRLLNENNSSLEEIRTELERIALIHPRTSFSLRNDCTGEIIFQTSKTKFVYQTFTSLYGKDLLKILKKVYYKENEVSISGLISIETSKMSKKFQLLYVNKRFLHKCKIYKLFNQLLSKSYIVKPRPEECEVNFKVPVAEKQNQIIYIINIHCSVTEYDVLDCTKIVFKNREKVFAYLEKAVMKFFKKYNLIEIQEKENKNCAVPNIRKLTTASELTGFVRGYKALRSVNSNKLGETIEQNNGLIEGKKKSVTSLALARELIPDNVSAVGKQIIMEKFLKSINHKNRYKMDEDIQCDNLHARSQLGNIEQITINSSETNHRDNEIISKQNQKSYITTFTEINVSHKNTNRNFQFNFNPNITEMNIIPFKDLFQNKENHCNSGQIQQSKQQKYHSSTSNAVDVRNVAHIKKYNYYFRRTETTLSHRGVSSHRYTFNQSKLVERTRKIMHSTDFIRSVKQIPLHNHFNAVNHKNVRTNYIKLTSHKKLPSATEMIMNTCFDKKENENKYNSYYPHLMPTLEHENNKVNNFTFSPNLKEKVKERESNLNNTKAKILVSRGDCKALEHPQTNYNSRNFIFTEKLKSNFPYDNPSDISLNTDNEKACGFSRPLGLKSQDLEANINKKHLFDLGYKNIFMRNNEKNFTENNILNKPTLNPSTRLSDIKDPNLKMYKNMNDVFNSENNYNNFTRHYTENTNTGNKQVLKPFTNINNITFSSQPNGNIPNNFNLNSPSFKASNTNFHKSLHDTTFDFQRINNNAEKTFRENKELERNHTNLEEFHGYLKSRTLTKDLPNESKQPSKLVNSNFNFLQNNNTNTQLKQMFHRNTTNSALSFLKECDRFNFRSDLSGEKVSRRKKCFNENIANLDAKKVKRNFHENEIRNEAETASLKSSSDFSNESLKRFVNPKENIKNMCSKSFRDKHRDEVFRSPPPKRHRMFKNKETTLPSKSTLKYTDKQIKKRLVHPVNIPTNLTSPGQLSQAKTTVTYDSHIKSKLIYGSARQLDRNNTRLNYKLHAADSDVDKNNNGQNDFNNISKKKENVSLCLNTNTKSIEEKSFEKLSVIAPEQTSQHIPENMLDVSHRKSIEENNKPSEQIEKINKSFSENINQQQNVFNTNNFFTTNTSNKLEVANAEKELLSGVQNLFNTNNFTLVNDTCKPQIRNADTEDSSHLSISLSFLKDISPKSRTSVSQNQDRSKSLFNVSKANLNLSFLTNSFYNTAESCKVHKNIQKEELELQENIADKSESQNISNTSQKVDNFEVTQNPQNLLENTRQFCCFSNDKCTGNTMIETNEANMLTDISNIEKDNANSDIENTGKFVENTDNTFNFSSVNIIEDSVNVKDILNNFKNNFINAKQNIKDKNVNTNKSIIHLEENATHTNNAAENTETEVTDKSEENHTEWLKQQTLSGRSFFVNSRTGMSCFQNETSTPFSFSITERHFFMPKGMSPIMMKSPGANNSKAENLLSPTSKNDLYKKISKTDNELRTVKWLKYFETKDPEIFFKELYQKTQQYESEIPVLPNNKKHSEHLEKLTFSKDIFDNIEFLNQWDNKFLVTKAVYENVTLLILFDQHAVHERIRLEKLLNAYKEDENEKLKTIKCSPITIKISYSEFAMLSNYKENFEQIGVIYNLQDKDQVIFTHVPMCWHPKGDTKIADNENARMRSLLERLIKEKSDCFATSKKMINSLPACIQDVIKMEACRGAVKFGDNLSSEECVKYIKELSSCNLPFQCAHGRPTMIPIFQFIYENNLKESCRINFSQLNNKKR